MNFDTDSTTTAINKRCPVCGGDLKISNYGAYSECPNCNYRSITHTGDLSTDQVLDLLKDINTKEHTIQPDKNVGGMYGWICPKCGAVISPFTSVCPNCTKQNWEITYTATDTPILQSQLKSNFDVNKFIGGRKDKLGYE